MSLAGIRFDYIHAERIADVKSIRLIADVKSIRLNADVNYHFNKAIKAGDVTEVPFIISVTSDPNFVTITIRGIVIIQGDIDSADRDRKIQKIMATATQLTAFEVALILRKLGIPPVFVLPSPPPQQQVQYFYL